MRWNPSGDMIASSSWDGTAKLLDLKTGKVLHTDATSDGSKYLLTNINQSSLILRFGLLCLLYLKSSRSKTKEKTERENSVDNIKKEILSIRMNQKK